MPVKLGPPAPGTNRRLTKGEAAVLGCSDRWHISAQPDGIWLLKPWRPSEWSGPGPRLSHVGMTAKRMEWMRGTLRRFWAGKRVVLSPQEVSRLAAALQDALLTQPPPRLRKELEWAADTVSGQ